MSEFKPEILLLGAGYTLKKVAHEIGMERVLLTHTSDAGVQQSRDEGFKAVKVDLRYQDEVDVLVRHLRSIRIIVDSVPPTRPDYSAGIHRILARMDESDPGLRKLIQGVIYLSSTGVYGGQKGESVTEASVPKPYDERGRARLQCEQEWQKSGIRTAILRLSAIYGDDKGLIQVLKEGNYRLVKGRWSNRIHVDDIVAVIVKLLHTDIKLWPPVMSLSDDEPTLIDDVVEYYCTKLDIKAPGVVTATESMSGFDRSNQKIDNSLLKKFMGQQLKFPNYKSILLRNK